MSMLIAEQELYNACRILFGPDLQVTRDFLEYLQLSGIKSAFRQKAMETHPDRAGGPGGLNQCPSAALFRDVREAYEKLTQFLEAREKGFRLAGPPPAFYSGRPAGRTRTASHPHAGTWRGAASRSEPASRQRPQPPPKTRATETFYRGPLPQRRLLLGHYLYYSGLITWRMIIQALIWQRTQRPRLGQLGRRLGWLNEEDVRRILQQHQFNQPFGQTAVRLGLLTDLQLRTLLFQQKRLQKKFGQYFVENRLLPPDTFAELLIRFHRHNNRMAASLLRHGNTF